LAATNSTTLRTPFAAVLWVATILPTVAAILALLGLEEMSTLLLVAIPMAPTLAEIPSRHLEITTTLATLAMDQAEMMTLDRAELVVQEVSIIRLLAVEVLARMS